jgi:hypothetical protein
MAFVTNSLDFPNLTNKATPIGADIILLADSASGNAVKQTTISALPFAPATGTAVVNVTSATQALAINTTYFVNYAGGVCTLTLPAGAAQGSLIWIIGGESISNAFVIAQLASQSIRIIDQITTVGVGGSLTAVNKFNSILLHCDDAAGTGLFWSAFTMGSWNGV